MASEPFTRPSSSPSQGPGNSGGLFPLTLLTEQLDDLLYCRGVLRLLVCVPEGDHPRKTQGKPRLITDLAGRMSRAGRDFVGHHLDHHLGLEPYVWHENRIHPCRPMIDL